MHIKAASKNANTKYARMDLILQLESYIILQLLAQGKN